jgi:hypothetical protein
MKEVVATAVSSLGECVPYCQEGDVSSHRNCTYQKLKYNYKYFKVVFTKYFPISKLNT